MRLTTKRALEAVLMMALLGVLPAGCGGGGGDKAGGSDAPAVLRFAVAEDAQQADGRLARDFASRVGKLSGGSLRIELVYDAAGQETADPEGKIIRMVRDGEFDLGFVSARNWDAFGVKSFQALQAPFLVTSNALLGRIATGPLGSRMLGTGLEGQRFVGLALVPDSLRYALGVRGPLASPDDFASARIRVRPSHATDVLIRALGASPVRIGSEDVERALANDEMDGAEAALGTNSAGEGEIFLTANVPLFAKALTLFADRLAYDRLDEEQRAVVRKAAEQTAAHAAANPPSESALVRRFCASGPPAAAVIASQDDVAALTRAAQPAYAELERDPETKALIAGIRKLKGETPAAPITVPRACQDRDAKTTETAAPGKHPGSVLNGTYRYTLTKEGAVASGGNPDDPDIGQIVTLTMRDGKWTAGGAVGTYEIVGERLEMTWPKEAATFTLTFKRRGDGTLDVEADPSMHPGDAFQWAGAPWRRIGPPVRDIP